MVDSKILVGSPDRKYCPDCRFLVGSPDRNYSPGRQVSGRKSR